MVGYLVSNVATASFRAAVSDGEEPQVETEMVVTASAAIACGTNEVDNASANKDAPSETFFILPPFI